jgi:hypothetical protein
MQRRLSMNKKQKKLLKKTKEYVSTHDYQFGNFMVAEARRASMAFEELVKVTPTTNIKYLLAELHELRTWKREHEEKEK